MSQSLYVAPGCFCAHGGCSHHTLINLLPDGRCPLLGDWWAPLVGRDELVPFCHSCCSQASYRGEVNLDRVGEMARIDGPALTFEDELGPSAPV